MRPAPAWVATRRRTLAELDALEAPLFLLAERAPGDAAIGERLARVSHDAGSGDGDAGADTTSPSPSPAAADPARDALLNLIDTRLARIADAARQASPKEPARHAPT